jgi:membrane associated rhomboid family serine protease
MLEKILGDAKLRIPFFLSLIVGLAASVVVGYYSIYQLVVFIGART